MYPSFHHLLLNRNWLTLHQQFIKLSQRFSCYKTRCSLDLKNGCTLRRTLGTVPHLDDVHVDALVRKASEKAEAGKCSYQLRTVLDTLRQHQSELVELDKMGKDDPQLKDMASTDALEIKKSVDELVTTLVEIILDEEDEPEDVAQELVLEVSAGVGGQEAMLFTEELFHMYESFALFKGWTFETISFSVTDIGGARLASARIEGQGVYRSLKYESGVHRVQRVPKTERAGRIHTSTSTVAILPAPSEIQIQINPVDIKVESKRASGAGGQHVNKSETAVRITHFPSGIIIDSQTQRSHSQNLKTGMLLLRSRLFELEKASRIKQRNTSRKLQTGLGTRNEKIRTYNFPQDRVTDHRIGYNLHNIEGVFRGQEQFDTLVSKLKEFDKNESIHSILYGK